MRLRAAGVGSAGLVRQNNDDHYCLAQMVEQTAATLLELDTASRLFCDYGLLLAVADGMGGYHGGGLASGLVLETLAAQFYAEKRTGCSAGEFAGCLQRYVATATEVLCGRLQRDPALAEAGTTLAGVALMPPDHLVVFHVGDSRVLRCCSGFCRQLTVDHTPLGPDVLSGRVTVEEAQAQPGGDKLTRALGLVGDTRPELLADSQWKVGERFFVGTDGVFGMGRGVAPTELKSLLLAAEPAEEVAAAVLSAALQSDGSDNATLVIVDLQEGAGE